MSKINPDNFDSKSIFDDDSQDNLKRGWSGTKLKVLFDALLREVSGSSSLIAPFFESISLTINSTDGTLELDVTPHAGILNGFDKTKIVLLDGETNILTEDSVFTIDNGGGRSYVTINFPVMVPNKTYVLKFNIGALYNGVTPNILHTYNLTTEIVEVKPVFGTPVLTPSDGNHNTLSNIAVPVTSFHGGRNLTFTASANVTGGAITTGALTFDQETLTLNIPVTASNPSITYDVNISQDTLVDISTGSDPVVKQFVTPDEVKPSFVDVTTDSGTNKSFDITKLYINITSASYLNLGRGEGTLSIGINGGATVDPAPYTEDFGNDRLVVDLTDSELNTITSNDKLIENTQYDISMTADLLKDGSLSSDLESLNSITTDNENIPGLSGLTSDTGTLAYGVTQFEIDVTGGPFLYIVSDNNFTTDFSGVEINSGVTNINGGPGAITTQDNAGQLTKIIIPVQNISEGTAYTVEIPADSVKDGSRGNVLFSSIHTTDTEVKPTLDLANCVPVDAVSNVDFTSISEIDIKLSDLAYTALRAVDLSLITAVGSVQGNLSFSSRSLDINNKKIDLTLSTSLTELETVTFTIPQGTIADGSTLNDASNGDYAFITRAKSDTKPTFNFTGSAPANDANDVSQQVTQITIPINSSHEIALNTNDNLDASDIFVIKDGGSDISGTPSISGTNLIIPVTLVNGSSYEVSLLQGSLYDGALLSDATTAGQYDFVVNTPVPTATNRWSFVLPANNDEVSGTVFMDSGTRDLANAGSGVVTGNLYDDSMSASPIWWMKNFSPQASRRIWIFEVKPDSATSIPLYGGGVSADKARVLDSDLLSLSNATSSNNSSIFSIFNFDSGNTLNWSQAGPSSLYLEFVEFDSEVNITIAQEWSNSQDWSVHAGV